MSSSINLADGTYMYLLTIINREANHFWGSTIFGQFEWSLTLQQHIPTAVDCLPSEHDQKAGDLYTSINATCGMFDPYWWFWHSPAFSNQRIILDCLALNSATFLSVPRHLPPIWTSSYRAPFLGKCDGVANSSKKRWFALDSIPKIIQ